MSIDLLDLCEPSDTMPSWLQRLLYHRNYEIITDEVEHPEDLPFPSLGELVNCIPRYMYYVFVVNK